MKPTVCEYYFWGLNEQKVDLFGQSFLEFLSQGKSEAISVKIDGEEQDPLDPGYFFRSPEQMPQLELIALDLCEGTVLDVGAAAGCHSLALQQNGLNVSALEISQGGCKVMKERGLKEVIHADFFSHKGSKIDTILLLMNGFGMGHNVEGTIRMLQHAKTLMKPGAQILGDTSDISYLKDVPENYDEEIKKEKPSPLLLNNYYGNVHFELEWKELRSNFDWIYPDPDLLQYCSHKAGLAFDLIAEGPHYDYLVRLSN
ncbi:MAG: class I SAM-dependent methyltransferase [Flavobacteriales bacterium]|nr:class I SAM-dependent methyltransferase [Flavobacteriales bacterium]